MADSSDQPVGYLPPPPGVTPNFAHPRDEWRTANIVGLSVCCGFMTFFVLIRAYVRLFVVRRILVADWTCLIGYVGSQSWRPRDSVLVLIVSKLLALTHAGTAITSESHRPQTALLFTDRKLQCHATASATLPGRSPGRIMSSSSRYGFLRRQSVSIARNQLTSQWLYAASVVYIPAAFFIKVTLLLLIAHVFTIRAKVKRGIYIFIYFLLVAYIPVETLKITACHPVRAFWDPSISQFGCMNLRRLYITDLVLAGVTDLVILLLPIPIIWPMKLPLKEKLKILFMLSAGAIAVGLVIFRLVKIVIVVDSPDISKDFVILDLTAYVASAYCENMTLTRFPDISSSPLV